MNFNKTTDRTLQFAEGLVPPAKEKLVKMAFNKAFTTDYTPRRVISKRGTVRA